MAPITCPQLASLLEQCRRTGQRLGLKPKHGYIPSARLARTGYQQAYLPKENEAQTTNVSLQLDKESFLAKKLLLRSVTIDRACYIAAVMIEGDNSELLGPTLKDLKMARVEDFLRNSLGIENLAFHNSELIEHSEMEEGKFLEQGLPDIGLSELRVMQMVDTEDCSMIVHPATPYKKRDSGLRQEEIVVNKGVSEVIIGNKGEGFQKCSETDESYINERHRSFLDMETYEASGRKYEGDNECGFATENIENIEIHSGSGTDVGEQRIESENMSRSEMKVNTERVIEMDILDNVKRKEVMSKMEGLKENVKENAPNVQTFEKVQQISSNISQEDATEDSQEDYDTDQSEVSRKEGDDEEALVFLVTPRPEESVSSLREEVLADFSWFDCSNVSVTQVVGRLEVSVVGDRELGLAALVGLETKYSIGFKPQVEEDAVLFHMGSYLS